MAIVIDFDVLEEGADHFFPRRQLLIEEFGFEGAPKSFHGGVVITIALAAHAAGCQAGTQQSLVSLAGVLKSAVGMEKQTGRRPAQTQGLLERLLGQARAQMVGGVPAHDPAAVEIHDGGQVKPTFLCANLGTVGHPNLMGSIGCRSVGQQIGRGFGTWLGGAWPKRPLSFGP